MYDEGLGIHEFDDEVLSRVLKVNLEAPLRLMRDVVADMVKRGNGGTILNIVGQSMPDAGTGVAFIASKEGLVSRESS